MVEKTGERKRYSEEEIIALQKGIDDLIGGYTMEIGDLMVDKYPEEDKKINALAADVIFMRGFRQGLAVGAGGYPLIAVGDSVIQLSRYLPEKKGNI